MTDWKIAAIALLLLTLLVGLPAILSEECNTKDWTKEPPPTEITFWYECK